MTKQSVHERAGAGMLLGQFVGPLYLTGNLAFTNDETVETGDHAEEMAHRIDVAVRVQVGPNFVGCNPMKLRKEGPDVIARKGARSRREPLNDLSQVKFNAVTRAQDHCLAGQARRQGI
jgi:hypothetical protein